MTASEIKSAFSADGNAIPRTLTPEQRQTVRSRLGKVSAECMAEAVYPLLNTLDAVEKELAELKAKAITREELAKVIWLSCGYPEADWQPYLEQTQRGERPIPTVVMAFRSADALISAGVQVKKISKEGILDWLANSRDTGASSKSLAFEYLGIEQKNIDWPLDPADFGRCARLIKRFPGVRAAVDSLAQKSKYWKTLAERWDEITHQMQIESGLYWEKKKKAKKTYDLIQEIISRVERDP